ncbi:MAG: ankyrin repeat domain-containing protein [Spirochaetes bacterium]|nr:ankyrin repeat domain-containing protein [Spirochaetota bacterium]
MNKIISAFLSGLLCFTSACTGKYLSKDDYSVSRLNMHDENPSLALKNYPSGEKKSFIVAMEKTYLGLISGNYDVSLLFKYRQKVDNQIKYQISRETKSFFYLHTPEGYYASEHEIIMMHILLSWGFSGQKKYEEAEVEARKASTLFSKELNDKGKFDDPLIRIMLAYVWTLCGNWEEARVDFRAAYKLKNSLHWAIKLAEMEKQPENLFFIFGGPGVEPEWDNSSNNELISGMKGIRFESKAKRSDLTIYDAYRKHIPLFITPDSSAWYKRHIERNNSIREFVQDMHYGKKIAAHGTLSVLQIIGSVSLGIVIITAGFAAGVLIAYWGLTGGSPELIGLAFVPVIFAFKLGVGIAAERYDAAMRSYYKNVDPSNYYRFVRFLPEYMWVGWTNDSVNYPIKIIKKYEPVITIDSETFINNGNKVTSAFYPDVYRKVISSTSHEDTNESTSLIHKAIANNKDTALENLLKIGEDKEVLNKEGLTPLQYALKYHKIHSFKILLKYGAEPYCFYDDGDNIITKAARNINSVYISILIDNGIDCNSYDNNGKTPLICAIEDYAVETFKILLKNKADVNLASKKDKRTPLHYGVLRNNKSIVENLLKYDADINLKDAEGLTPADYANKMGYLDILELIHNINK